MIFGYARVSTEEQSLNRQIDALNSYGVDELLTEKMTGTKRNRPELDRLLDKVRKGDVIDVICSTITPGGRIAVILHHDDGKSETIWANHTYNEQQIRWFKAGSALNSLK